MAKYSLHYVVKTCEKDRHICVPPLEHIFHAHIIANLLALGSPQPRDTGK